MVDQKVKKKRVVQNDPKGAVLKSVKSDLLCGGIHQISIFRPSVIIDSHMHIGSGRCAPLAYLQSIYGILSKPWSSFSISRGNNKNSDLGARKNGFI